MHRYVAATRERGNWRDKIIALGDSRASCSPPSYAGYEGESEPRCIRTCLSLAGGGGKAHPRHSSATHPPRGQDSCMPRESWIIHHHPTHAGLQTLFSPSPRACRASATHQPAACRCGFSSPLVRQPNAGQPSQGPPIPHRFGDDDVPRRPSSRSITPWLLCPLTNSSSATPPPPSFTWRTDDT